MKPHSCSKFVLILIFLNCRELYGQIGTCNLSSIEHEHNFCDNFNYLVYISESDCNGRTSCWCILVDNRNRKHDGQEIEIEMDESFRVTWIRAKRLDLDNYNSLELKFRIAAGINRIYLQPFTSTSQAPKIQSFKIDDTEICNILNRKKKQVYVPYKDELYIEPENAQIQLVAQPKQTQQVQSANDDYVYLNDCIQRSTYTSNSERFCTNDNGRDFVIEKRYFSRAGRYWCISVNNDKDKFTTANRLKISFSSQNNFLAWIPSDSYIKQDTAESNFHLGNRRTIVAVSVHTGELPNLNAVTIDGQPICNYFAPSVTVPPPTRSTTSVYVPPIYNVVTERFPIVPQHTEKPIEQQNKPSFNKNCGVKPPKRVTLISYGTNTNPGDWPWHAAIYKLQSKTNRNYICGGTLIDRKTIITAAHCVLDLNLVIIPDRIIVELGRYDLSSIGPGTQEFKVFDVIPHESYNPDTIENDIAILVLANYVQLTTYVSFICLPELNMNLQSQVGKTVGWGRDQHNKLQEELKEASMPVIDNIMCLSSNREFFGQYLTNTNFCAGYRNNTNVCRGDSGGGLVFKFGNQWFLGGVTSLGVSSKSTEFECDITQYAIFTDVTKFVKWIKQNS